MPRDSLRNRLALPVQCKLVDVYRYVESEDLVPRLSLTPKSSRGAGRSRSPCHGSREEGGDGGGGEKRVATSEYDKSNYVLFRVESS